MTLVHELGAEDAVTDECPPPENAHARGLRGDRGGAPPRCYPQAGIVLVERRILASQY
jgi:hypothetical protein